MIDSRILSVIAGLTVGIAVIVLFSMAIQSDYSLSDDELIARYGNIPEIKYFLAKHPDATINVDRYDYGMPTVSVSYTIERQVDAPSRLNSGIHLLYVSVTGKPLGHPIMDIGCGYSGMTVSTQLTNTDMIDSMATNCFTPRT